MNPFAIHLGTVEILLKKPKKTQFWMGCSFTVEEDDEHFLHSFVILVRFNKITADGLLIDITEHANKMSGKRSLKRKELAKASLKVKATRAKENIKKEKANAYRQLKLSHTRRSRSR